MKTYKPATKLKSQMKLLNLLVLLILPSCLFANPDLMDISKLPERFAKADVAFLDRVNAANAMEALNMYRAIYKKLPNDADAAWRVSMACYFVGFNMTRDAKARIKLYAEGRAAGLEAVKHNPLSTEAHFWVGVNMALYGQEIGIFKMLFTLGDVRKHLEKSLKLDPRYAYGGASRILGKIDESLPEIIGGSKKRARRYYEQSIEYAPDEPLNYFFLARLLLEHYKDKPRSLKAAYQGLKVRVEEPYRFESFEGIKLIKEFLEINDRTKKRQ